MSTVIGIGVDPGLSGAVAAVCASPLATAVRHSRGVGGYHVAHTSGRLASRVCMEAVLSVLGALHVEHGVDIKGAQTWAVLEDLMLRHGRTEGASRISKQSRDHGKWQTVLDLRADVVIVRNAQWVDRRAGLRRVTTGRKARKVEVATYLDGLVSQGRLAPYNHTPPGCRTRQDGIDDAVQCAVAALRSAGVKL